MTYAEEKEAWIKRQVEQSLESNYRSSNTRFEDERPGREQAQEQAPPEPDNQAEYVEMLEKIIEQKGGEENITDEDIPNIVSKALKQVAPVTPAAAVGRSGQPSSSPTFDDLVQELAAIQAGEFGNPHSKQNVDRAAELHKQITESDPMLDLDNEEDYIKAKRRGYTANMFREFPHVWHGVALSFALSDVVYGTPGGDRISAPSHPDTRRPYRAPEVCAWGHRRAI